jgi:hypothetical protein
LLDLVCLVGDLVILRGGMMQGVRKHARPIHQCGKMACFSAGRILFSVPFSRVFSRDTPFSQKGASAKRVLMGDPSTRLLRAKKYLTSTPPANLDFCTLHLAIVIKLLSQLQPPPSHRPLQPHFLYPIPPFTNPSTKCLAAASLAARPLVPRTPSRKFCLRVGCSSLLTGLKAFFQGWSRVPRRSCPPSSPQG